jgi:phosphatidylserine decarboxylase
MAKEIIYRDRRSGEMLSESLVLPKIQTRILGSRMGIFVGNMLLNTHFFCWMLGKWLDRAGSRKTIQKFIEKYDLNLDEVEHPVDAYPNLNAFFSRRLKAGARPFVDDEKVFCSPADGKVMVFPELDAATRMPVKGAYVDIVALMASEEAARSYRGGAAIVIRLAPYDYHRYHFPVEGMSTSTEEILGRYYLVNPIALEVMPDLFAHNKRMVTYLETEHFGRVMMMEVAGFAVGRIVQTFESGPVLRGQEKGYFQFGGSTLVLLFEPGRIVFDDDLVTDSKVGVEVQVQTGTQLGVEA